MTRFPVTFCVAGLLAVAFGPQSHAALILQLDASDGSTVINTGGGAAGHGDSVGFWTDPIAVQFTSPAPAAIGPTYNTLGGPLGQPVIDFNGPNANLVTNTAIQAQTISLVHRWDTGTSGTPSYLLDARAGIPNSFVWQGSFGPNWTVFVNNSTTATGAVADIRHGAWQITTLVGSSAAADDLHLMSRFTDNEFGLGSIGEIRIFDTALSESERLAVVEELNTKWFSGPAPVGPQLITPVALTVNAGSEFFPADNLINDSGLSGPANLGNYLGVTHAASSSGNAWVTDAFFPDYYSGGGVIPVMTFELGDEFDLTDLVAWNYSIPGNAAREMMLLFLTDDGTTLTGMATVEIPQAGGPVHTISLGDTFTADTVQALFTTNWTGFGAGGDRVGLAELKFIGSLSAADVPEPGSALLLLIGGAAVVTRRRRAAA